MLYKKIHRQYLREFRVGRRFEYRGDIYEITRGPFFLTPRRIWIDRGIGNCMSILSESGKMQYKEIVWLED